jgi:hypothetical protein
MNEVTRKSRCPRTDLPALLALGPLVIRSIVHLRTFVVAYRAFSEGAHSLRQAHKLSCEHAGAWGIDASLVENWQKFRRAAWISENVFDIYFACKGSLFIRLGEGLPWIGVTPRVATAYRLAKEVIVWWDQLEARCEY